MGSRTLTGPCLPRNKHIFRPTLQSECGLIARPDPEVGCYSRQNGVMSVKRTLPDRIQSHFLVRTAKGPIVGQQGGLIVFN